MFSGDTLAKLVCILPLLGGSRGFVPVPPDRHAPLLGQGPTAATGRPDPPLLKNSYLDDLTPPSSSQHPKEGGNSGGMTPPSWNGPPPAAGGVPTGGIPSGRGPEKSYLEKITGGGGASPAGEDNSGEHQGGHVTPDISEFAPAPPERKEMPASWSNTGAYLAGKNEGEPGFLTSEGGDDSRTDVRNLLTQRSIQSFMYLLEECRDPHSAKWIQEDFLQTGNLLDFHGTGAGFIERFGGTWECALLAMMNQPRTKIIVHAKRRGRGHGGWSKNNPYLKERFVQIPVNIDPVSLASRILEVREQIAREWESDLDVVAEANGIVMESYFAGVKANRDMDNGSTGEALRGGDIGLDSGVSLPSSSSVAGSHAFDRAEFLLPGASSPFRRGNFDLLYNLCTQAAIHRLLREDRASGRERDISYLWLRDFYVKRAAFFFDGDQTYARADDFLDEMLRMIPSVVTAEEGRRAGLSDPVAVVERILRRRGEVVEEWKEIMRRVQDEHVFVRRVILSKQVESWDGSSEMPVATARSESNDELGAFE